jgi:uncharacterized membrane protein YhaH (DUF805 family)
MENPYAAPTATITAPITSSAPLTWKQILFSFEGRIPRRIFWGYTLLSMGIGWGAFFLMSLILPQMLLFALGAIAYIAILWAGLALSAKRWHDRDKSAAWILIAFIPIVGGIWSFVECGCLRGTEGANKYGGDPT